MPAPAPAAGALAPLHRQSPIAMPASEGLSIGCNEGFLLLGGSTAQILVEHNWHTVQSTLMASSERRVCVAAQVYRLLQFHLHTPSEHIIDGGGVATMTDTKGY